MAYKIFMTMDGLTTDTGIELQTFGWGVSNPINSGGGGGGGGKAQFNDLVVIKSYDKTSPSLFKGCAGGKHFPTVQLQALTVNEDGLPDFNNPIYQINLTDIVITSMQTQGSADGGDRPSEQLTINFNKIDYKY